MQIYCLLLSRDVASAVSSGYAAKAAAGPDLCFYMKEPVSGSLIINLIDHVDALTACCVISTSQRFDARYQIWMKSCNGAALFTVLKFLSDQQTGLCTPAPPNGG